MNAAPGDSARRAVVALASAAALLSAPFVLVGCANETNPPAPSSVPSSRPYVGTFRVTGDMTALRSFHTATLLAGGRVLIAGGFVPGSRSGAIASVELYDPVIGTFRVTGDMTVPRMDHTATLLADGRVLITGGTRAADVGLIGVASAELYDPASGTFAATGDMTVPRVFHAATLLADGRVLITGGTRSADVGLGSVASAELYDPASGTFTATGDLTVPRLGHTATLLPDGRVLIAGGIETRDASLFASAELYDPATGSFTRTGNMTSARALQTATLLADGRVLLAAGTDSAVESRALASAELYDTSNGTFTRTKDLTVPRLAETATLLWDGRVLIAGGTNSGSSLASAELYDPASASFTSTGFMTTAHASHTATLLANGQVLIAGGPGNDRAPVSAELFE
jgi:hypothetical protein